MANEPFFKRDGALFVPTPSSRGPWNATSLHGRVIIALLAHEMEQKHGSADFMPVRLTVDMYQLPDMSPVEVTTRVIRAGNRIRVIDAEFISGGKSVARATCQMLKRGENPEGNRWTRPNWDAPHPDKIELPAGRSGPFGGMWAMKPVTGNVGTLGQKKQTWMSEVRSTVDDEPLTPFLRVASACDFASPFANAGDQGLGFINSDVTLYLHRLPVGEWIGFEAANHDATEGVAIGECYLYDVEGHIGSASCAAVAQRRMTGPDRPMTAQSETKASANK